MRRVFSSQWGQLNKAIMYYGGATMVEPVVHSECSKNFQLLMGSAKKAMRGEDPINLSTYRQRLADYCSHSTSPRWLSEQFHVGRNCIGSCRDIE